MAIVFCAPIEYPAVLELKEIITFSLGSGLAPPPRAICQLRKPDLVSSVKVGPLFLRRSRSLVFPTAGRLGRQSRHLIF